MLRKLKWMALPVIYSLLLSVPIQSANAGDPPGQILGGSINSPVRLEVFSDFECPACREYYLGTIKKILEEYSSQDKVCVIYHEFPLRMHRYARQAAQYTEAAYRLGRQQMLQVFDVLYVNQAEWAESGKLEETISKALTAEDFKKVKELAEEPSIKSAIEDEVQLANEKGISSTPTTFIYYIGKQQKVEGVLTHLVLKGFIDKIVK
jgi:protein-disulfide isomerase